MNPPTPSGGGWYEWYVEFKVLTSLDCCPPVMATGDVESLLTLEDTHRERERERGRGRH